MNYCYKFLQTKYKNKPDFGAGDLVVFDEALFVCLYFTELSNQINFIIIIITTILHDRFVNKILQWYIGICLLTGRHFCVRIQKMNSR